MGIIKATKEERRYQSQEGYSCCKKLSSVWGKVTHPINEWSSSDIEFSAIDSSGRSSVFSNRELRQKSSISESYQMLEYSMLSDAVCMFFLQTNIKKAICDNLTRMSDVVD